MKCLMKGVFKAALTVGICFVVAIAVGGLAASTQPLMELIFEDSLIAILTAYSFASVLLACLLREFL